MVYSKDMVIGIFLSNAKFSIELKKDERYAVGYSARMLFSFRAKEEFCVALQRSLLQHNITSRIKLKESSSRPKPILLISGMDNMNRIEDIINFNLPDVNGEIKRFKECYELMQSNQHHTYDGVLKLMGIKTQMRNKNGINKYESETGYTINR